jgi:hypothetical protein
MESPPETTKAIGMLDMLHPPTQEQKEKKSKSGFLGGCVATLKATGYPKSIARTNIARSRATVR